MNETTTSSAGAASESLYARHEKVYPREVTGRFARLRKLSVLALLGLYYAMPWLQWEGRQAVLFDLPARKFHLPGLTLWPQDFIYLTLLLVLAALSLFFVTAIAGRLWCGYACPQTVWTEVFIWMEQLTEGKRNRRIKLDRGPWTMEKLLRKGAKQFLWITFALFTGFTFIGYFMPIRELAAHILALELGGWPTFWGLFYSAATYGNAGFLREQVCKYMCPYARFQSAMFDRDTLVISYDTQRGEPRGRRKRGTDPRSSGLGDCIDCTLCVQVCPTGIDIREGLQYECIACAACIDACDTVMDRMGYPSGLVRYSSQHAIDGEPSRVLRPRVAVYSVLLAGLAIGFVFSLLNRVPLELDILRERNALYRVIAQDQLENLYTLKILNMDNDPHRFRLAVSGLPGITVNTGEDDVAVDGGAVRSLRARVRVDPQLVSPGGHDIVLELRAVGRPDLRVEERTRFIVPGGG